MVFYAIWKIGAIVQNIYGQNSLCATSFAALMSVTGGNYTAGAGPDGRTGCTGESRKDPTWGLL